MTVPPGYNFLDSTGIIVPDTSATQAVVNAAYTGAFGADLILTADTPQGVLATADTLALNGVLQNNAAVANQINPNVAGGILLDAILALTGVQRGGQTQTVVTNVTMTGTVGTTIPINSQAQTAAGDIFYLTAAVIIPSGGSITGTFKSVAYGPIPCAENSLNIITPSSPGVIGWESVNNGVSSVTTLGAITQSDQAARAFRTNTLAYNSVSLAEAITSALSATQGVTSLSFRENFNATPMGMLISITGGATLAGKVEAMSTTAGSGTLGGIIIDTDAMHFSVNGQTIPTPNPWPVAAYATTGNITLSGLGTQSGGDWTGSLTGGQIILAVAQTTASQNGLWVASSGAWTRQAYNASASTILPSSSGISLKPNSVYACVNGGTNLAIGAVLLENKGSGAGWNGNTTVNVIEPASSQIYPVQFDIPTQVGIQIAVTVKGATVSQVTQALIDYSNGVVTDPSGNPANLAGFVVGGNVSPFELASAIMIENPASYVSSLTISLISPTSFQATPIPIGINQIPFTNLGLITVTIVT